ncbi:carboxypeptidase [Elysia marginata]|uniref:Carboxypeptidase n=1 Tax=Elysia marginata TaxID=1093978 RepID=A0AAV4K008_9GAST|nr:carboxypeptidase [Elysia marginata]
MLSKGSNHILLDQLLAMPAGSVDATPPCTGDAQVVKYLNRPDVKQALHISEEALEWAMCRFGFNITIRV